MSSGAMTDSGGIVGACEPPPPIENAAGPLIVGLLCPPQSSPNARKLPSGYYFRNNLVSKDLFGQLPLLSKGLPTEINIRGTI